MHATARRSYALIASVMAAMIVLAIILPGTSTSPSLASAAAPADAAAGALYLPSVLGLAPALGLPHYCSASVVHSTGHDLLITAAHCVDGTGLGIEFAPGYHDGITPFGVWTVTAAYVDPGWRTTNDPHLDVAILRVAEHGSRNIEDVVGAHALGAAPPAGTAVEVTGYAAGSNDDPVRCAARTYLTTGYPTVDCDGFVGGTSGGPWVDHNGHVVGVIGGLHEGGCAAAISYSAPFGVSTAQLLARANAHAPSDLTFPPAGDGC